MWLTALATIAKRTGYPVVERAGWKTRGRAPMSGAKSIICHHTAGGASGNYPSLGVVQNGRAGLPGPLAQLGLGRDGTIYVIAAGRANHAGVVDTTAHSNSYAIGIEAENTGRGEKWSNAQMDAYAKLCRELCDHYGIPISQVRGHKEVARPKGRKPDPSFDMAAFRKMVKARKGTGGSSSTTTGGSSSPSYKSVDYGDLLKLYTKGAPVKEWQQKALGYTGAKADGFFGPGTEKDTKAFQREHGVTADGVVGPKTWPLRNGKSKPKHESPAFPLPKGHFYYTEDSRNTVHSGYWEKDRAAIRKIQRAVGAVVDGLYGAGTKSKVQAKQRKLGVTPDGAVGATTWAKLF